MQDALLKAQADHTEASAQLTANLLLRRQQLQDELAAADLPGLQYVPIGQHAFTHRTLLLCWTAMPGM